MERTKMKRQKEAEVDEDSEESRAQMNRMRRKDLAMDVCNN